MSLYLHNNSVYSLTTKENTDLKETLPVGTYLVIYDTFFKVYRLQKVNDFILPNKIYGKLSKQAERIISTYLDRPKTTGLLLSGEKGSGKTLLAQLIAIKLAEKGIITIIVNSAFFGDLFNKFLQDIEQPCHIIFDEYEKTYSKEEQEQMLTLLDGVFSSKKLFTLTCNEHLRIDVNMNNRPGRIFYALSFKGMDKEAIIGYCKDKLHENLHVHIDQISEFSESFENFNFDMLKALVEEMNRYMEGPKSALEMLNVKNESVGLIYYDIELYINNKKIAKNLLHDKYVYLENGPFNKAIAYNIPEEDRVIRPKKDNEDNEDNEDDEDDYSYRVCHFTDEDFARKEGKNLIFINENKEMLRLVKQNRSYKRNNSQFDWD